jgi:hypothetical protein
LGSPEKKRQARGQLEVVERAHRRTGRIGGLGEEQKTGRGQHGLQGDAHRRLVRGAGRLALAPYREKTPRFVRRHGPAEGAFEKRGQAVGKRRERFRPGGPRRRGDRDRRGPRRLRRRDHRRRRGPRLQLRLRAAVGHKGQIVQQHMVAAERRTVHPQTPDRFPRHRGETAENRLVRAFGQFGNQ